MDQPNQNSSGARVKIYSTPTCVFCKAAKDFFTKNQVSFEDYNVAENLEKREEMAGLTGGQMSVPVIVAGEEIMIGFNEGKLREVLQIS